MDIRGLGASMAKFARIFIVPKHRLWLNILISLLTFGAMVVSAAWYSIHSSVETMEMEMVEAEEHFADLRQRLTDTFAIVERDVTASPCSAPFMAQLRRVAFLPDGLSEFLYAPRGKVECSTASHRFEQAIDFGKPDIVRTYGRLWVNRDLGVLGLEGERGTIVLRGNIAVVVPISAARFSKPDWLDVEGVIRADTGQWWHRGGDEGIYEQVKTGGEHWLLSGMLSNFSCGPLGLHCVAVRINLPALISSQRPLIDAVVVMMAVLSLFLTREFDKMMQRYWSFESRLRRSLDANSVMCVYQPLMSLEHNEIVGCEVLARWRDIDGSTVYPDRFLPLIEQEAATLKFTELVARRACEELSRMLPAGRKLQVNFNIFPCDLDHKKLLAVYSGFLAQPERFDVVLEIIESEEIPPNAQHEIEMLRAAGVKTFIDDFGSGYSTMQSLAALSVDGVKLDRSFAMAADDTMMGRMLHHAVEMIHATGRVMVIEGVETQERLRLLRKMKTQIDLVQGYYISHPLPIACFIDYLEARAVEPVQPRRRKKPAVVAA